MSKNRAQMMGKGQTGVEDGDINERSGNMTDKLRNAGGEIYDEVRDSFQQGRKAVRHWEEGVERYIQEKPLRSLLIAAGVGWLIGAIWRRL
jgi:ElaB/YqjD/DUF883 family membrane-anchored ribosome-binding protein